MSAVLIEAQDHITDNWIIDIVAVCSAKKKPLRKSFPKIASSFRRCVGTIETTTTASMLGIVGFSGLVVNLGFHACFFLLSVEHFCFDAFIIITEAFSEDIDPPDMAGGFRDGNFNGDFRPVI